MSTVESLARFAQCAEGEPVIGSPSFFQRLLKLDHAPTQTRTGTPLRERDFKRLIGVRTTSEIRCHRGNGRFH